MFSRQMQGRMGRTPQYGTSLITSS